MRLIDNKGRLFGKINIFDLFVLCLFAATIVLAFKWVIMAEDPSWVDVKILHTRCIAVAVPYAPSYIVDLIKEGDEAYNDDGLVVGKVEKVLIEKEVFQPTMTVYTSKEGEKLFFSSDKSIAKETVTVQLDLLSYEKKGDIYAVVSGAPIRIGLSVVIKTKKYSLTFIIHKILNTGD